MRTKIVALAIVFLAAHVPFLPPTLEDIDSINFALGVRDFDVSKHQPHPPGYPVFIGLGKLSTPVMQAAGVRGAAPRGLAVWSAISGAALVPLLFALFQALDGDRRRAFWACVLAVASPLFWFTALRPLSDTTGLALSVAAQALIVSVLTGRGTPRALIGGALVAGVAIGCRSQSFLLTLPLLGLAIAAPRTTVRIPERLAALAAFVLGVLVWAIPLISASGGPIGYAEALGTQAGEDFSGVVMLWNMRTARVAADAMIYTFLWPWGGMAAGAVAIATASLGGARAAWRMPRTLAILLVAFVPYAVFHLLFHEVVTVRYALPLVVPVAYLSVVALDGRPRRAMPAVVSAAALASLAFTLPAAVLYAREGSPAFAALRDASSSSAAAPAPLDESPVPPRRQVIAYDAVARRAAQWLAGTFDRPVLTARHGREWLTLVEQWRELPGSTVWFVADPRRTDLALFDPTARSLERRYRWGFVEPPFVGGARPGNSDLYRMRPPGWMLDRGWAVTPEVAGIAARDGWGPHRRPSVAWIRTRTGGALLMLGGRNLAPATAPPARIGVTIAGRPLLDFDAPPGFFFQVVPLPAAAVAGHGAYLPLEVTSRSSDGSAAEVPVGLEQFDLQGPGVPMIGVEQGWQEAEYDPRRALAWRWASERATLWVRPIGRDVTLTISGESPLRYFDAAPAITVTVGGEVVARFSPSADFTQQIALPAAALDAADGRVVMSSDKWFVPGDRDGGADRRHLALRIYESAVR